MCAEMVLLKILSPLFITLIKVLTIPSAVLTDLVISANVKCFLYINIYLNAKSMYMR